MDEGNIKISNTQIIGILEVEEGKNGIKTIWTNHGPNFPKFGVKTYRFMNFSKSESE